MVILASQPLSQGPPCGRLQPTARPTAFAWLLAVVLSACALLSAAPAFAVEPIAIDDSRDRIEITTRGLIFENRGDSLQVETAAGLDGMSSRMSVQAKTQGTNPNWVVFALTNPTNQRIERWLTAERYSVAGSGAIWPDLDARRVETVTPSLGFVPERLANDRADVFRITLEPGQTITYAAELSSGRYVRMYLWKSLAYELKVRDRQLFNGTMLGLTGFLAIFLTAIFGANHKAIFPSAALVAWCVLAYLCAEFGFFHKLFNLRPEDNAVYRAASEAAIAASLLIFLHTFLRLGYTHGVLRMLISVWMLAQLALVAVAVIDPRLAATFARLSFILIGAVGGLVTLYLSLRGQDRALSLIPTWMMFLVWIFGAAATLTGRLSGDVIVAGLIAGLVLVVMLIGFTVTQYAFRSIEPMYGAAPSQQQVRSLAIDGAGAATWEWGSRRNDIKVDTACESLLGLTGGELSTGVDEFIRHVHPGDRDRFQNMLWSVKEHVGGKINTDFRMRHTDGSYRWFELEAASVPSAEPSHVRCIGLIRDVTNARRAHERLMHDAVHDSLTGLPNRELYLDRLGVAIDRARDDAKVRPTVLFIDLDKFKSVNDTYGLVVGDSLLLTIARRLQKHMGNRDTIARVSGDQFAVLVMSDTDPNALSQMAEAIITSIRSPIRIAGQDIVLTGALGIAVYNERTDDAHELLKEAEIAMYRAKRGGSDRIELFRPEMRNERDDRVAIESDLRRALERGQIKVLFQPIVYLPTEELAGFEALVRWEHPKHGILSPDMFVPVAEESDLIVKLGSYVLMRAAHTAARWHKELPRTEHPLFVSVNISSRQLFRNDLIQEIRHIVGRAVVPPGALRLEITESLVMQNPEQATEMLEMLRGAGAKLALDDFGTGYSSLAYLQRFPFNTIKIDRALVQASGSGDGAGSTIVRSMVALAHELGKTVVAEGVERPDDVGFLRSIGCEYAQGFYYGEPMRDRDVIQLLRIVRKTERKLEGRGLFRSKAKKAAPKKEIAPPPTIKPTNTPAVAANAADAVSAAAAQSGLSGAAHATVAGAPNGSGAMPPVPARGAANGAHTSNGNGNGMRPGQGNATPTPPPSNGSMSVVMPTQQAGRSGVGPGADPARSPVNGGANASPSPAGMVPSAPMPAPPMPGTLPTSPPNERMAAAMLGAGHTLAPQPPSQPAPIAYGSHQPLPYGTASPTAAPQPANPQGLPLQESVITAGGIARDVRPSMPLAKDQPNAHGNEQRPFSVSQAAASTNGGTGRRPPENGATPVDLDVNVGRQSEEWMIGDGGPAGATPPPLMPIAARPVSSPLSAAAPASPSQYRMAQPTAPPPMRRQAAASPLPDYSKLPPGIADSLKRLAGVSEPLPQPDERGPSPPPTPPKVPVR